MADLIKPWLKIKDLADLGYPYSIRGCDLMRTFFCDSRELSVYLLPILSLALSLTSASISAWSGNEKMVECGFIRLAGGSSNGGANPQCLVPFGLRRRRVTV